MGGGETEGLAEDRWRALTREQAGLPPLFKALIHAESRQSYLFPVLDAYERGFNVVPGGTPSSVVEDGGGGKRQVDQAPVRKRKIGVLEGGIFQEGAAVN